MNIYFRYLKNYKLPFFMATSFVTLEAVCDLLGPTIMASLINSQLEAGNLDQVYKYGTLMIAITLIGAAFAFFRNILASTVSQKIGVDLREDLFTKILNFSETSVDELPSGTLITRMTNDTNQIIQFINGIMRIFLKAPITCIGSIVLASLLNFKLSLIIYSVVVIIGFLVFISLRLSYPRFGQLQIAMDKLNAFTQEYLLGIRLIKAFGTYDEEEAKFKIGNDTIMKKSISAQIIVTLISPLLSLSVGIAGVLAIYFGNQLFLNGEILPGDISAFIIYMAQMLVSIMMITNIFNVFVRTQASSVRIDEVFAASADFIDNKKYPKIKGELEFRNVCFSYPQGSGLSALDDLSFKINAKEKLAIIGPTGSGKSTLVWLLLRFYDVNSGTILIDGNPIDELSVSHLRQNIALAAQKATLFYGSVKDNMIWGKPKSSKQDITKAMTIAQADFVYDMDQGLDSQISSGSVNISGGQKQRISLVRALLKKSPILILDDVTSALDAITEAKIRDALLKQEGTLIMITQKCSTAMFADKILVLENGLARGFGSHNELLDSCPIYKAIYRSQISGEQKDKYYE